MTKVIGQEKPRNVLMGSEGEWEFLRAEEEKSCSWGNSLCRVPVVGVWNVKRRLSESCG